MKDAIAPNILVALGVRKEQEMVVIKRDHLLRKTEERNSSQDRLKQSGKQVGCPGVASPAQ